VVNGERQAAEAARQRTREALDEMSSQVIEDWLSRQEKLEPAQRDFLEKALAFYDGFAAESGQTEAARHGVAGAHLRVGKIRDKLGQRAEAEAAYVRARELYARLAAEFPAVPQYRQELARSHNSLGLLLSDTGRPKEAEAAYTDARDIQKALAAEFPAEPQYRQELARSHNNLGILLRDTSRFKEAEGAYRDALELLKPLAKDFPKVPQYSHLLAGVHINLSDLLSVTGRPKEAGEAFRDGLDLTKRLADDFPGRPEFREQLATIHHNMGNGLSAEGRPKDAEASYREALVLQKALAKDFPAVPRYRQQLARTHTHLGNLLAETGRPKEAEAAYTDALALQKGLAAEFPTVPDYHNDLAGSLVNRAGLANGWRDFGAARRDLAEALPHHQEALQASATNWTYRRFYRNNLLHLIPCCAGLQDQAAAVRAAQTLRDLDWDHAVNAYDAACCLALCIPVVEKDPQADAGRRQQQARFYGDQALAMLRIAVARGFKDAALMKKDTDLDPLRQRDDFQKLLAEVEAAARPKGGARP
jgi:tetratricopeptide (TPR) repeat protein